jgi:hypothetical protein
MEPQVGRKCWLVRVLGGETACVRYERFADGSALAVADAAYARSKGLDPERFAGGTVLNADESDTAWQRLWSQLAADGFVELSQARSAGLVPQRWTPPGAAPGLRW